MATERDLITEARALCAKATPGPWWNESGVVHAKGPLWTPDNHSCVHPLRGEWNDAEFAAEARTIIPALCDALGSLQAQLAESERREKAAVALIPRECGTCANWDKSRGKPYTCKAGGCILWNGREGWQWSGPQPPKEGKDDA